MKSEKLVIEELSRMKSLFGYERGRVISEQSVVGAPNYGVTSTTVTPAPAAPVAPATPQATTLPDVTVKSNLTPRQKNINNSFCSVKNGVIVNPSSGENGKQWSQYVIDYKVTAAEIAISQKKCPNSGAAVKTAAPRKPDPKVMELQKQLKAAGYDLGTSGPNKDGIDGFMGAKTKAAQQQMIQQKGQDAFKTLSKQGQDLQNKWKQMGQMKPEQIAYAKALKAGQPLPQTKAPVAPAASAAPVPVGPKPTGLGFANEERDGWYYDAITKDWYTQPQ
jgi:hypothetical protein